MPRGLIVGNETREAPAFSQAMLRNISWNFIGQLIMAALTFFTMPYIVHSLGLDLYGLYGLASVVIGYFAFLQMGLGPATIKFIAEYLAKGEEKGVRAVFWTSLCAHGILGIAGLALISASLPYLVTHFLKISPALRQTALIVCYLTAAGFFIGLIMGVMAGVVQAAGRFDILNKVGIALGILQLASAVLLLKIGFSLKAVVVSGVLVQICGVYWYWRNVRALLPYIRRPTFDRKTVFGLFAFGGFITISSIVVPFLMNVEKIFLTSLVSISFLTYYLVPFSVMDSLSIVRSSFSLVLFQSFSYLHGARERSAMIELHMRSSVAMFFIYAFFALFFIMLGKPFLFCWIGNDFAEHSAAILAVLSTAGLINALAIPSLLVLNGSGKPQFPAIFHVAEAVLYVPGCYFMIKFFGLLGAAEAWACRVAVDTALLLYASCGVLDVKIISWCRSFALRVLTPVSACAVLFAGIRVSRIPLLSFGGVTGVAAVFCVYALLVWFLGLDDLSREKARIFLKGIRRR